MSTSGCRPDLEFGFSHKRFDDRIDVALAAYNGGPSRAARWLAAAGDDPDLFLEFITLREPLIYIQRIKEHLAVYRALYGD